MTRCSWWCVQCCWWVWSSCSSSPPTRAPSSSTPDMPRASSILVLLAIALAGCSPLNRSVSESELVKGNRHVLIEGVNAPEVDGPRGCGAQALAAAIACADPAQPSSDVAAQLPWHDVGATPVDLLLEARRRGFDAVIERGTLERLTDLTSQQQPALVMIDA